MQIRFDKERLQRPPGDVPTPYLKRMAQFQYVPCSGATYDLSFTEGTPSDAESGRPLRFHESILKDSARRPT